MTPAPSSSFSFSFAYDVFLSFRGTDTRYGFTGNLYEALSNKGNKTFIDDEELQKGEEITPTLLKAIEESKIAIVVFSKNYASSSFCLEELVKILECFKQNGRLVWPIFYEVNPSEVRHLIGSFGEAMARHEKRFKNDEGRVKKWKLALQEAANLSGSHFQQGVEYEHKFIKRIVKEISRRTSQILLHVAEYPIGLESRVQKLNSLLDIGSDKEVMMIGICGIGGIGKTTIARAIYNLIADQFEGICFLANVRENSNNRGLVQLQETMLFEILGEKDIKLTDVFKGISIIKSRLCRKKILLILDDVDELGQLKQLAGGLDWFGLGSRIIITTRNEHLLHVGGVERKYELKALSHGEARKLFTWNAFKGKNFDSSYGNVLYKFLRYCHGLPLALEVIGSNLFGKRLDEWKSALNAYEDVPNKTIQQILKISYDGLGEIEKDMGKEIVRQESLLEPGKRSRLWFHEDILHVFEENTGTENIEAIVLRIIEDGKVHWDGDALRKMKNLKLLIIEGVCCSVAPKHLPNSLRWLEWKNYACQVLLQDFKSLSEIDLSGSVSLNRIPDISGTSNLKRLHFNDCPNLIEVHDSVRLLDKLCSLKASNCTNLEIFPRAIKSTSLESLDLSGCLSLQSVPEMTGNTGKKRVVYFSGCIDDEGPIYRYDDESFVLRNSDFGLMLISGALMVPKLEKMKERFRRLSKCRIEDEERVNVRSLYLTGCNITVKYHHTWLPCLISFKALDFYWNYSVLEYLSTWAHCFPNLEVLDLSGNCGDIYLSTKHPCFTNLTSFSPEFNNLADEFVSSCLPWFPNLQELNLAENNFTILPECVSECRFLRRINLNDCKQLREIRGMPPNIKYLSAVNFTLLNAQSSSMLLSQGVIFFDGNWSLSFIQTLHQASSKLFNVPGAAVPEWFDYRRPSTSLSFWVRNKFHERIAVSFVHNYWNKYSLLINGISYCEINLNVSWKPHVYLVNLPTGKDLVREVAIRDGWNQFEVVFDDSDPGYIGNVSWIGVHVYNKKKEDTAEDDQFTDSNARKEKADADDDVDDINRNNYPSLKKRGPLLDMEFFGIRPYRSSRRSYFPRPHGGQGELWKIQAPAKVKMLVWQIYLECLPTCEYLFKRELINSPLCPICESEYESVEHVFLICPWTRAAWFASDLRWSIDVEWYGSFTEWLRDRIDEICAVHPDAYQIHGIVGNICWAIWKGRNEYVLEGKPVDPTLALFRAKNLLNQNSHRYPWNQTVVESTSATTYQGEVRDNYNNAKRNYILAECSSSNTESKKGFSWDDEETWDLRITKSTNNKETEKVRKSGLPEKKKKKKVRNSDEKDKGKSISTAYNSNNEVKEELDGLSSRNDTFPDSARIIEVREGDTEVDAERKRGEDRCSWLLGFAIQLLRCLPLRKD